MVEEKKEVICKAGKVWVEDGILRTYTTVKEMGIEDAKDAAEVGSKLMKEAGVNLMLVYFGECKKISSEARKYWSRVSPTWPVKARKVALLVKNPVARVIGSFFFGAKQTRSPDEDVRQRGRCRQVAKGVGGKIW